jgi:hypothetical protein
MQGKSEKHQPSDGWQCGLSLRLRGHSSTEGAPARKKWQSRRELLGLGDRCTYCCMTQTGRVGAAAVALHVWELVAQRGDAPFRKSRGRALQRWVFHAGAGAVGEHQQGARGAGPVEQCRHHALRVDADADALAIAHTASPATVSRTTSAARWWYCSRSGGALGWQVPDEQAPAALCNSGRDRANARY